MNDVRVLAIVETVVLFRRQCEAEKTRLLVLAALTGGAGAGAGTAAFAGRWGEAVAGAVIAFGSGSLWEWRWSKAMRVPGTESPQTKAAAGPAHATRLARAKERYGGPW